uniref:Mannosyltransferase n=1 Tax=Cacopsylla melanoneura TaxID=428564 RepID=A0A8D8YQP1_9HEMI
MGIQSILSRQEYCSNLSCPRSSTLYPQVISRLVSTQCYNSLHSTCGSTSCILCPLLCNRLQYLQAIDTWERLNAKFHRIENMREKISLARQMKRLPSYQYQGVFTLAVILVIGTFNRPTFLAFGLAPVFYWLYRGIGTKHVTLYHFHMRILCLVSCALPLTCLVILTDSLYYGKTTLQTLLDCNLYIGYSFTVTPYNFIKYNMNPNNLAQHGTHPLLTHTLVNLPLLYNVLAVVAFVAVYKILIVAMRKQWNSLPRVQSTQFLMFLSLLTPLFFLSLFPHQEPRFIIPLTLPMVFLFSPNIYAANWGMQEQADGSYRLSERGKSGVSGISVAGKLIRLWFLCNMSLTLVYGFLHQAGVYSMVKHMAGEIQSKPPATEIHLVTTYTYTMPLSLLGIPNYQNTLYLDKTGKKYRKKQAFFTYELGSATARQLCTKLSSILDSNEKKKAEQKLGYRTFVALPGSRYSNFVTYPTCMNISHTIVTSIFPHVTLEALPQLVPGSTPAQDKCPYASAWENSLQMLAELLDQFKIVLIQIQPSPVGSAGTRNM